MNHFFLGYFFIVTAFVIRGLYAGHKFIQYCKIHYPEKAKEFMNLGIFSLTRAVFERHAIDDLDFVILKNKAKNGFACICFVFLLGIFLYFIHQNVK